ncbi:MAG: phosphatidate cytidylyltransferase [Propionibacteriaceae bacterium]|nr:phosphatidate cytidylyltransferase [Propionibacteriaceae bacterium]
MSSDCPGAAPVGASVSATAPAPRSKLATLAVRTASALVLVAVIAITLAWWHPGFIVIMAAMITLGVLELRSAARHVGIEPTWQIIVVAAPVIMIGSYVVARHSDHPIVIMMITVTIALIATALICLAWRLRRGVHGYLADAGMSVLMLAYLPGMALFVVAMMVSRHPIELVVSYAVCIVANDSGAYLLGSAIGRHKMTPGISPAKTWEGFAGGVILAAIIGCLVGAFLMHTGMWQGVVFGVVLAVCATLGDLAESAIKRDAGVKDSGRFLPGHGGVLDRMDSMLFCAPVAFGCYALMGVL